MRRHDALPLFVLHAELLFDLAHVADSSGSFSRLSKMRFCFRLGSAGCAEHALAGLHVAVQAGAAPIMAPVADVQWSAMPTCPAMTT